MKKITSLQFLTLMTLALGSSFVTECYGGSDKYADKSKKSASSKGGQKEESMKCLEKQLHQIKREFKKNHDQDEALRKLKALEPKIKALIARMKKSEKHGKMWEVHEHTLNRKLREIRDYVQNYSENKTVKVQSRTEAQALA